MSTQQSTVDFLMDQLSEVGSISNRKMFGEYALYCDMKVVALICDDQLFIKPTEAGRKFIKQVNEQPPYPGAKNYFLISDDHLDDREWLSELIQLTAKELPLPKPKKKRALK
jgi:DNA transformation protein